MATPVQSGPERLTVEGLFQGAEFYLVAVDQSDEEKQWAERDDTSQHSFHQQHCPTAQQEDMDKQPEDTAERNTMQVIDKQRMHARDFRYFITSHIMKLE